MPRFLIEVSHEDDHVACTRAVHVLLTTGSHYLTHADWGCKDGVHKAWIIVEVDSKEEALRILPATYRADAKVTGLNKFTLEELESLMAKHER